MASLKWSEYTYAALTTAGLNRSAARDRVIELLGEQTCALSAIAIEEELRRRGHPIARATVYRTLDLLVEHGLAERIVVGEGQARFEPLEPDGHHHHHLVCGQCGALVAFADPGLEQAIDSLSDRLGVSVDSHDVLLRGACERCC
ncbi:MAG: transcriptional repressor [Solirubrobacteraceae bacterium]|jgi:Fur family ferric uptake transcriptional regulator